MRLLFEFAKVDMKYGRGRTYGGHKGWEPCTRPRRLVSIQAVDIHFLNDGSGGTSTDNLVASVANDGKLFVWRLRATDGSIDSEQLFATTGDVALAGQNDRVALCSLPSGSVMLAAILGGKALVWEDAWDEMGDTNAKATQPASGITAPLTALDMMPVGGGGAAAIAVGAADGSVSVCAYIPGSGVSFVSAPFAAHAGGRWGGVASVTFCERSAAAHRTTLLTAGEGSYKICLWSVDVSGAEPPECIHTLAVPDLPGAPPRCPLLAALEREARLLLIVSSAAGTGPQPSTILAYQLSSDLSSLSLTGQFNANARVLSFSPISSSADLSNGGPPPPAPGRDVQLLCVQTNGVQCLTIHADQIGEGDAAAAPVPPLPAALAALSMAAPAPAASLAPAQAIPMAARKLSGSFPKPPPTPPPAPPRSDTTVGPTEDTGAPAASTPVRLSPVLPPPGLLAPPVAPVAVPAAPVAAPAALVPSMADMAAGVAAAASTSAAQQVSALLATNQSVLLDAMRQEFAAMIKQVRARAPTPAYERFPRMPSPLLRFFPLLILSGRPFFFASDAGRGGAAPRSGGRRLALIDRVGRRRCDDRCRPCDRCRHPPSSTSACRSGLPPSCLGNHAAANRRAISLNDVSSPPRHLACCIAHGPHRRHCRDGH